MAKTDIDEARVRALADLLDELKLSEIEYAAGQAVAVPAQAPAASPAAQTEVAGETGVEAVPPGAVTSPMVGTVYLAPEPDAPPFVTVGEKVGEGQTVMLIEAMKTFNEIRAPRAGEVKQILVENATPVEYGDVLLIVE